MNVFLIKYSSESHLRVRSDGSSRQRLHVSDQFISEAVFICKYRALGVSKCVVKLLEMKRSRQLQAFILHPVGYQKLFRPSRHTDIIITGHSHTHAGILHQCFLRECLSPNAQL